MQPNIDKSYLKDHLLEYLRFQLKQGYELADVKQALKRYGYHKNLVEEVAHRITPGDIPERKGPQRPLSDMDKELSMYVKQMLVDFIVKEEKLGYEIPAIRRALINFGHHPGAVDSAIRQISEGEVFDLQSSKIVQLHSPVLLAIAVLVFFVFTVFLSISTNVSITTVLYGFMPAASAILSCYLLSVVIGNLSYRKLIPLLGAAIALGAYMILLQTSPTIQALPGTHVILGLNIVLAFMLTSLFSFFSKRASDEIIVKAGKRQVMYRPMR